MSGAWRVEITRYTGGAEYRLMRFDECYGQFDDIEELKRFGELVKKELNTKMIIPLRESVRHDYEEIVRLIEEVEE